MKNEGKKLEKYEDLEDGQKVLFEYDGETCKGEMHQCDDGTFAILHDLIHAPSWDAGVKFWALGKAWLRGCCIACEKSICSEEYGFENLRLAEPAPAKKRAKSAKMRDVRVCWDDVEYTEGFIDGESIELFAADLEKRIEDRDKLSQQIKAKRKLLNRHANMVANGELD